jgi:hypothetical protein
MSCIPPSCGLRLLRVLGVSGVRVWGWAVQTPDSAPSSNTDWCAEGSAPARVGVGAATTLAGELTYLEELVQRFAGVHGIQNYPSSKCNLLHERKLRVLAHSIAGSFRLRVQQASPADVRAS